MYRLLILFVCGLAACLPAVEETCETLATQHCEQCTTCSVEFSPTALCDVDANTCRESIITRCETQAATVPDPKNELQTCADALEAYQCTEFMSAYASGARPLPQECDYFL